MDISLEDEKFLVHLIEASDRKPIILDRARALVSALGVESTQALPTHVSGVGSLSAGLETDRSPWPEVAFWYSYKDPLDRNLEITVCSVNLKDPTLSPDEGGVDFENQSADFMWKQAKEVLKDLLLQHDIRFNYMKDDIENRSFTLRQYPLGSFVPGPHWEPRFAFHLDEVTPQTRKKRVSHYFLTIDRYEDEILNCEQGLKKWWIGKKKKERLAKRKAQLLEQKEFFIRSQPNPKEFHPGVLFSMSVQSFQGSQIARKKTEAILNFFCKQLTNADHLRER